MFHFHQTARWLLLCAWPSWAIAQVSAPTPLSPLASPPAPTTSAPPVTPTLPGYQAMTQEPLADWRQTNATVQRIGGWRAYAREAAAPSVATPEQKPPAPSSHVHH